MNDINHIKSLVRQAKFYYSQGFLKEARNKYNEAIKLVQTGKTFQSWNSPFTRLIAIQKQEYLMSNIVKNKKAVEASLEEIEKTSDTYE